MPKKACAMHLQIRARIAHAQQGTCDAPSNSRAHRACRKRRARCTFKFARASRMIQLLPHDDEGQQEDQLDSKGSRSCASYVHRILPWQSPAMFMLLQLFAPYRQGGKCNQQLCLIFFLDYATTALQRLPFIFTILIALLPLWGTMKQNKGYSGRADLRIPK